jgi:hypothetical protein
MIVTEDVEKLESAGTRSLTFLSPTASFRATASFADRRRWRVDTCTLIFGHCATREAQRNGELPFKTKLPCKNKK